MRVLIDTNVFLSYILAPTAPRAITTLVIACFSQDAIELLIPPEQITEFRSKATTKRYFRTRIPHADVEQFVVQLTAIAELLAPVEEVASYSRDPKDDYLIAYGVAHEANYLITGDADLLVLDQVGTMAIVKPSQFVAVLRASNLLP